MIRTETRQYWGESNYTYTFNVPSFSQVKKIYLLDNYLYMIIEYLEEFSLDTSKIINLKVQSQITPVEDSFYKYFDTQIVSKSELVNSSHGTGNIHFSTITLNEPYHFFIEEIKSQAELRDTKIDNIIN